MKDPAKHHQAVFEYLEAKEKEIPGLRYTLRKTNRYARLEKGFWFYGNDHYLAVSFWRGYDWKNKTPDIIFVITEDKCFLQIPASGNTEKSEFLITTLIPGIGEMKQEGSRWSKTYGESGAELEGQKYKERLDEFFSKDYGTIDRLIREYKYDGDDYYREMGIIDVETFHKYKAKRLVWAKRMLQDQNRVGKMSIGLKSLHIENFLRIKKLAISNIKPETRCIVFTGENGAGKSTLLKAIGLALLKDTSLFQPDEDCQINLKYYQDYAEQESQYDREGLMPDHRVGFQNFPGFAAYGPYRLEMDSKPLKVEQASSPNSSLFKFGIPLHGLDASLFHNDDSDMEAEDGTRPLGYLEAAQALIPNLLGIDGQTTPPTFEFAYQGHGGDVLDDTKRQEIKAGDIGKYKVRSDKMATGAKSILSLLNDMVIRLGASQEGDDITAYEGIVLIDEIDLHLHPNFQRRVLSNLTATFPRVQFIVTTHSPIPLLGAPKETQFFVVRHDFDNGVAVEPLDGMEIQYLTPNTILTSPIFGMDSLAHMTGEELEDSEGGDNLDIPREYLAEFYPEIEQNRKDLGELLHLYQERSKGGEL